MLHLPSAVYICGASGGFRVMALRIPAPRSPSASVIFLHGLEAEIKRGIDPSRIVVGGFSQGAALTQSLATTYTDHKLAGFISLSGFMPVPQALLKKRSDKNVDSPVFLAHGTDDPVVPFDELQNSKQQLTENFLFTDVEMHTYANMPHSVCLPELEDIFAFLERAFPAQ